jgi:hypothetical protein
MGGPSAACPVLIARRVASFQSGGISPGRRSKLHHVGMGRAHEGRCGLLLVCDLDIQFSGGGELGCAVGLVGGW